MFCSSSRATGSGRSAAGRHFVWLDGAARSRASKPLALRSSMLGCAIFRTAIRPTSRSDRDAARPQAASGSPCGAKAATARALPAARMRPVLYALRSPILPCRGGGNITQRGGRVLAGRAILTYGYGAEADNLPAIEATPGAARWTSAGVSRPGHHWGPDPHVGIGIAVYLVVAVPGSCPRRCAGGTAPTNEPSSTRSAPGWPGARQACGGSAQSWPGPGQEHVTMTAEPSESPVTEGVRSLEVRWIFPGRLETAVAGWFGRFPAEMESREDTYLLDPRLRGLSVKVRGGRALEVKVYRGGAGILEVAGRARGRMESWQKWSFPLSPLGQDSGDPAGWRPVRKRRRISRFSLASGQIVARAPGLGQEPRCEVELTEVRTRGQDWWTLGFEATGPADLLRSELQATAALVFAQALPGGVEPGPDESRSYAEWLCQRPGPKSDADA